MALSILDFTINKTSKGEYSKDSLSDLVVDFSVNSDLSGNWKVEALLLFSTHGGGLGTETSSITAGMTVAASKTATGVLNLSTYTDSITFPSTLLHDIGTYSVRLRVLPEPGSSGFITEDSSIFFTIDLNQADSNNTITDLQKSNLDVSQGLGGSSVSFSQAFTNQTTQIVVHNLNKYPNIVFRDNGGIEYEVDVVYDTLNQCTVNWNEVKSGTITCN